MSLDYPSFSIVIPTYQRRDRVCEAVRALCKARYRGKFEAIVVVDGSTDGTATALAEVTCPFPLRVIEQSNGGAGRARNRGAAAAQGEVLLFLDDDMVCEPDVLKRHAQSFRAGADAVVGAFVETAASGMRIWSPQTDQSGETLTAFEVFSGHLSVRRSAFEDVGGFDESFTENGGYGYEDADFGLRFSRRFSMRANADARCHHQRSIKPRDYIRRARKCADSAFRFAEKHPEVRKELDDRMGASRLSARTRLISRMPIFPNMLAESAAWVAEIMLRTPLRAHAQVDRLTRVAYTLAYWSTVGRHGGLSSVSRDIS